MSHKSTPGSEPIYDARTLGLPKMLVLGLQHLFAMFGATVLVPILVQGYGLPLSIQTTLFFCRHRHPLLPYLHPPEGTRLLGSSFAYLGGFSAVAALDSGAYATMEPSVKLQYAWRRHCSGRPALCDSGRRHQTGRRKEGHALPASCGHRAHHHPHRPQPGP